MMPQHQATLKCNAGQITTLVDFGITTHFEDQMQCARKYGNVCNKVLDERFVKDFFAQNCQGKKRCTLKDFGRLVSRRADDVAVHQCDDPLSRAFFQYKCE